MCYTTNYLGRMTDESILSCTWIIPMATVSCFSCAITSEVVDVRNVLDSTRTKILYLCSGKTCEMSWSDYIAELSYSCGASVNTPYIFLTITVYPILSAVVTMRHCYRCARWKKTLYAAQVLRLVDCRLHSIIPPWKIAVCARRVISLQTITTSLIVFTPACANFLPLSSFSMRRARSSSGFYSLIIFTVYILN